jgi:tRNA-splicing ligase RtcB
MKVTKKDEYKVPVFSWCENIEESAMEQIDHLAQLPFVHKRVCIMPDCHAGYGMPIGGVCALDNVICPSMVGVDIGCGMCAVKTSLTDLDTETLKNIMGKIREVIPVGFGHQKTEQDDSLMPKEVGNFKQHFSQEGMQEFALQAYTDEYPVVTRQYHSALKQLGTLGGGNHFIEIQKGSDGHI